MQVVVTQRVKAMPRTGSRQGAHRKSVCLASILCGAFHRENVYFKGTYFFFVLFLFFGPTELQIWMRIDVECNNVYIFAKDKDKTRGKYTDK